MPGDREWKRTDEPTGTNSPAASQLPEAGKSTLVERAPPVQLARTTPVQHQARTGTGPYVDRSREPTWTVQRKPDTSHAYPAEAVHAAAEHGIAGSPTPLPHRDQVQRAFGHHDVSGVKAHTEDAAREGATAMGAQAFASGDHVAFAGTPDLHTAAHEAAHIVQQRGGVQLKGGVGQEGDAYERHADQVADQVVRGESAEGLIDEVAGPATAGVAGHRNVASGVQKKDGADTSKKDRRPEPERRAEQSDNATYHAMNIQLKLLAYELDAAGRKLALDTAVANADKTPDKAQVKETNDRIWRPSITSMAWHETPQNSSTISIRRRTKPVWPRVVNA